MIVLVAELTVALYVELSVSVALASEAGGRASQEGGRASHAVEDVDAVQVRHALRHLVADSQQRRLPPQSAVPSADTAAAATPAPCPVTVQHIILRVAA